MATVEQLITDIAAVRNAGRAALADKGVTTSADATVYGVIQRIADVYQAGTAAEFSALCSALGLTAADIDALTTALDALNASGVSALADKGVTVAADANTADIVAAIEDIPSGGGGFEASVSYDDVTDNLFLTNNFYTICRTVMFGSTSANNSTSSQTDGAGLRGNNPVLGKLVDTSGSNVLYINGANGYQHFLTRYVFNGSSNNSSFTAVATGTGTGAPVKTDRTLTGINYADTVISPKKETLDDYSGTMVIEATIGNTSGSDRIINEIGVTSGVADSGDWNYKKILIARAVLSSPVTLANGDSKVFTIRIGLPTPE